MRILKTTCLMFLLLSLISCDWGHKVSEKENTANEVDSSDVNYISSDKYNSKTGIGPITHEVKLGDQIDEEMAAKGEELFNSKCSVCHQIHESARGPALGGVLDKRSPQFVMNMILNPDGMIESDPQIKALKAVYEIRMDNLHLTKEEAREIVEYLRTY